jgi:hypothetical protein
MGGAEKRFEVIEMRAKISRFSKDRLWHSLPSSDGELKQLGGSGKALSWSPGCFCFVRKPKI